MAGTLLVDYSYGMDFCFRSVRIWFLRNYMYLVLASLSFSARSRSVSSYGTVSSLFILGVFLIFLAEIPKRSEEIVSAMLLG